MAYIWNMDILLKKYNLWNEPRTFYEVRKFDSVHRVYMFANKIQHTNVKVKVNYAEFVKANS